MLAEIPFLYDLIGALGAVVVLTAYGLLQLEIMKAESFLFSFLNLLSSVMILFSLMYAWNLGAAMTETAWLVISGYGLFKGFARFDLKKKEWGFLLVF